MCLLLVRQMRLYLMKWPRKILVGGVYCSLLLVCSTALGALLACLICGALPAWPLAAFFLFWVVLFGSWHVLLFFGLWVMLNPPRGLLARLVYSFAAFVAGLLASSTFQTARPWDFDHDAVPPPTLPVQIVSLTTLLSCITAVASTAFCLWLVRHLFHYPPSNSTLQRTKAGGTSILYP